MKGASEAIKKAFKSAGNEMEELADKLEEEVDGVLRIFHYINITLTEKISEALAEALNIQSVGDNFLFSLTTFVLFSS